jgi:hypothetical protein
MRSGSFALPMMLFAMAGLQSGCLELDRSHDELDARAERAANSKADGVFGSCVDSGCDGPATNGNCYCTPDCAELGDCCEDFSEVCTSECNDFAFEFESQIGSGSGFSEVVVHARVLGHPEDELLGKTSFLSNTLRPERIEIPEATALSGGLILKLTGNHANVRNPKLTYNKGTQTYFAFNTTICLSSSPSYFWAPFPRSCGGSALEPGAPEVILVANQRSFRVESPEFKNAFLWARVTDDECRVGEGLLNTQSARVFWLEDSGNGVLVHNRFITTTSVLQTAAGKSGTLWVTSQNAFNGNPDANDGHCNVELFLEYR